MLSRLHQIASTIATAGLLSTALALPQTVSPRDEAHWVVRIRQHVAAKQLPAALDVAEQRLVAAPADLEARGWRGRLLAWSGKWKEAEADYRLVLERAPDDADILLGLADVLLWQQRNEEALVVLSHAGQAAPATPAVLVRRGRALRALSRGEEARAAFRQALHLNPNNQEAAAGLAALAAEWRHELRFGVDVDRLPFDENATALTASLNSRLNRAWSSSLAGTFHDRFGERAARFAGSLTFRPGRDRDYGAFTAGGAAARDQGVIPKGEAFFEYARAFKLAGHSFVRAIEPGYRQHWAWFDDTRVLALSPGVVIYLPRDWVWSVRLTAARTLFPAAPAEWQPSGLSRLSFPVRGRLSANAFFAVGTENFSLVDQVGRFSARTWGGGARVAFAPLQDISFYLFYQDRSQGRSQTSFGISYALRF